ncbi:MAG: PEGA domain-containing protein, partial [Candidatus Latescibacteria bacterium]|nr:PEGA domain-containing protein [Candidatus Latescibacterota bacterium]
MRIRLWVMPLVMWSITNSISLLSAAPADTLRGLRAVAPDTQQEEHHGFYRQSWAVVIGINDYEHWPKLAYAVNDAKGMEQTLVEILKIPRDHIITLYDREATKNHIQRVIGDELADPAKVQKDDRVLIFYAGHGGNRPLPDGRYRGYLIPVEADFEHLESTAIPMKALTEWAEAIPAKHVYYVLDACYSGLAMTRGGLPLKGGARAFIERVISRDARKILTAGGKDEQVADGGPRGHSVFTGNFLIALEGAGDVDGDGVVTASEVGQYVLKNVSAQARQTPAYGNLPGDQGGEVILNILEGVSPAYTEPAPSTPPSVPVKQTGAIRVVTTPERATVTIDGAYKGETPLVIADLSPGTYEVAIQLGGYAGATRSVTVNAGETYGMEVGLMQESGGLIVTSKPTGTEVMLDGVSRGVTSSTGLKIDGLKPGVYRLTVKREGYEDYADDVVVERQQTMKIVATLTPQNGGLSVTSTPSGATVIVDGSEKGLTPIEIPDLSAGSHRARVMRMGYEPAEESVTVESNRTVSRSYTL